MQFPIVTTGTDTIFEGAKSYWKTRVNLDLIIVYHPKNHCIEVVAHHPDLGKESRLYLSSLLILSKLDQNELQLRLGEKKEVFIKHRKPVNIPLLSKEVLYSSISNYIQSRLLYEVSEAGEDFSVTMQPLTGDNVVTDDAGSRLDCLITHPATLDPIMSHFQKKYSTKDIATAMNSLKTSAEELKRATRYAELATSSVDGFKIMLAEKMKLESEMKRRYSPARLRWIKAINRVLINNYCDIIRARLDAKASEKPAAAAGLTITTSFSGQSKSRIRILRKSIDNSELESNNGSNHLPPINASSPATNAASPKSIAHMSDMMIEKTASQDSSLPSLSGKQSLSSKVSQRRQTRMNNNMAGGATFNGGLLPTRLTRKSLNQDLLLQKYLPEITPRTSMMLLNSSSTGSTPSHYGSTKSPTAAANSSSVPSLLQSYNTMSQRLIAPLPLSVIQGDFTKDVFSQKVAVLCK